MICIKQGQDSYQYLLDNAKIQFTKVQRDLDIIVRRFILVRPLQPYMFQSLSFSKSNPSNSHFQLSNEGQEATLHFSC